MTEDNSVIFFTAHFLNVLSCVHVTKFRVAIILDIKDRGESDDKVIHELTFFPFPLLHAILKRPETSPRSYNFREI